MFKISPILMVILIGIIGFQTWQVFELRQEVKTLKVQTAALSKNSGQKAEVSEEFQELSALILTAASSATNGDVKAASNSLKQASALIERAMKQNPDGQKTLRELDKSRRSLETRLKELTSNGKKEER